MRVEEAVHLIDQKQTHLNMQKELSFPSMSVFWSECHQRNVEFPRHFHLIDNEEVRHALDCETVKERKFKTFLSEFHLAEEVFHAPPFLESMHDGNLELE
jgi:hypothetical protein